ncbi:hypothetical protein BV20DRAFT_614071 [Pilatotrama ljubarskyi]|nr:hypothetical protein BV20DRAFT_614071 [Pilatotrama ljubarskyi]
MHVPRRPALLSRVASTGLTISTHHGRSDSGESVCSLLIVAIPIVVLYQHPLCIESGIPAAHVRALGSKVMATRRRIASNTTAGDIMHC